MKRSKEQFYIHETINGHSDGGEWIFAKDLVSAKRIASKWQSTKDSRISISTAPYSENGTLLAYKGFLTSGKWVDLT